MKLKHNAGRPFHFIAGRTVAPSAPFSFITCHYGSSCEASLALGVLLNLESPATPQFKLPMNGHDSMKQGSAAVAFGNFPSALLACWQVYVATGKAAHIHLDV